MLNPADVLKIKCNFAKKVLAYITKRKYVANVCPCVLYPYYSEYGQVAVVNESCLEYEQECALNSNKYDDPTDCTDQTTSCANQLDITTTLTGRSCTLTAVVDNLVNGTAYPNMSLNADSSIITGTNYIKVTQTGDCASDATYSTLNGGTTSGGTAEEHKATFSFGFNSLNSFNGSDESYIKVLRVYKTDSLGTLVNTPINLDLDPSTSPYYSDNLLCPGCATITASEVEIGDSNFGDNFTLLMNNVSLSLFSTTDAQYITAASDGSNYQLYCKALNQPASYLFGINSADPYVMLYDPVSGSSFIQNKINAYYTTPSRFYASFSYAADDTLYECADLTPVTVADQWSLPSVSTGSTSFNKITLNSPFGMQPLSITTASTVTCSIDVLKALYDTTNVDEVWWTDPGDAIISTSSSAVAQDDGVYTFHVNLINGCSTTKTVRYP